MKNYIAIVVSFVFIVFGALSLMQSFSGITGFVVMENASPTIYSIFGVIMIVAGSVIFALSNLKREIK